MAQEFVRGTITGRQYKYAGCKVIWLNNNWQIYHGSNYLGHAHSIKEFQNKIRSMRLAKEGPWHVE